MVLGLSSICVAKQTLEDSGSSWMHGVFVALAVNKQAVELSVWW
jgi:hypothetical protein